MKYIIIDERKGHPDSFSSAETDDRESAIRSAENQWYKYFTDRERVMRAVYVLESVNPDEEAPDHFDGNVIWRAEK